MSTKFKYQNYNSSYFPGCFFIVIHFTKNLSDSAFVFGLIVKEKRWVVFKGEQDPTSIPGLYFILAIIQLLNI